MSKCKDYQCTVISPVISSLMEIEHVFGKAQYQVLQLGRGNSICQTSIWGTEWSFYGSPQRKWVPSAPKKSKESIWDRSFDDEGLHTLVPSSGD